MNTTPSETLVSAEFGREPGDAGDPVKKEKERENERLMQLNISGNKGWNEEKLYPVGSMESGNFSGTWNPYTEPKSCYIMEGNQVPSMEVPLFRAPLLQDVAPLSAETMRILPVPAEGAPSRQNSVHRDPPFQNPGTVTSLRRYHGHRGGRQREKTPPFQTEEERRQWEKERRKKDIHNKIEQRRRYNINDNINNLASILINAGCEIRQSKGIILEEAIRFIKTLCGEEQERILLEEEANRLQQESSMIALKIQDMQMLLQSEGFLPGSVGSQQATLPWFGQQVSSGNDFIPCHTDDMRLPPSAYCATGREYPSISHNKCFPPQNQNNYQF